MEYEAVIGLEIHAQLLTDSKHSAHARPALEPSLIPIPAPSVRECRVCYRVLNRKALEFTVRMALGVPLRNQRGQQVCTKELLLPYLPKNYQIFSVRASRSGTWMGGSRDRGSMRRIGLTRIHMEEDAGKLIHDERKPVSYVDLNRTACR